MLTPADREDARDTAVLPAVVIPVGLSTPDVENRRARGLGNVAAASPSRTVGQIVKANVFTRFNALLGALFAVIMVVGPLQDAMFGLILVFNTAIGVFQEWRAKLTLDRLAVVTAPQVRVIRNGATTVVRSGEVVVDEVIELHPGEQVVVDGTVVGSQGLEVDESLLTGESEPVAKTAGAGMLSGSFVAAGSGLMQATKVGEKAYGATLSAEARRFGLVRSELRDGINAMLRAITWVLVPVAGLLAWSQFTHNSNFKDAIRGSVAGTVTMVPEGLVLLTSIAFAVGVIRLARHRVVVRELPALEGLARVDVLCIDKTGTLTTGRLSLLSVIPFGTNTDTDVRDVLAALAASDDSANTTMTAIREGVGKSVDPPKPSEQLAFSSSRKYSGADFGARGCWVLGAPEVLLAQIPAASAAPVLVQVDQAVKAGRRALLLAGACRLPMDGVLADAGELDPAALVVLRDELRPDADQTLAFLTAEGVRVKVISGDHPDTVHFIAAELGLQTVGPPVDARTLPSTASAELSEALEHCDVFGRVTPHQKRAMVNALQSAGHTVAMTGDGVNDVLALKDADLGIAMGSGTAAARAVAQLVLLDDEFGAVPTVVAEGRRVIANVERVANLFLTKTVYATVLALAVGVARLPFPFLPRHLTLVSSLTIGIPGFFLALAPNSRRAQRGFTGRVLRFAVPAGLVAAAATFAAYSLARAEPSTTLDSARTVATLVLAGVALWILSILARPATRPRQWLIASMVGLLILALALPWTRRYFALQLPRPVLWLAGVGVAALAGVALEAGWLAADSARFVKTTAAERLATRRSRRGR